MDTFGIISGHIATATPEINRQRNEELKDDLLFLGYTVKEVKGSWKGAPERSLLVFNPRFYHLRDLGQRYGQEAIVYNDSLVPLVASSPQPQFMQMSRRLATTSRVAARWVTSQDRDF